MWCKIFWTKEHSVTYSSDFLSTRLTVPGTLRTQYSEYSYVDQTPAEIAYDQGDHELARILAPVIRSPVPAAVLAKLQADFHWLIRYHLGDTVDQEHLYLPVLEVLTELAGESVWFGVKRSESKNAVSAYHL
jgi:hypothetical protein